MTMITPSYLGETIEYSSLHACRSTLEDPTWQEGDMLKPEQAQEALKQYYVEDWQQRRLSALAKLPKALREPGRALMVHDPQGKPIEDRDVRQQTLDRAIKQLETMSARDRLKLFETFFPRLADHIEDGWKLLSQLPYQRNYDRKPFRSPRLTIASRQSRKEWLTELIDNLSAYEQDITWLAAWAAHVGQYGMADKIGLLLAAAINGGGPEGDAVFDILCQSARGEHKIGAMGRHITRALLAAARPDGWEFVEQLLLAAQRQEGLRQVILETIDEAHPEAFRRMLRLIMEHDLARFSSVVRALDVWFGFHWDSVSVKVVNQVLQQAVRYLEEPDARQVALESDDAETVYLALWALAFEDAQLAVPTAAQLLKDVQVERRFVAVHLLGQLDLPEARNELRQALEDEDPRIALRALENCRGWMDWEDSDAPDLVESNRPGQGRRTQPPTDEEDLFERVEHLLARMPAKKTPLEPIVWPWHVFVADKQRVAADLLSYLNERAPTRLIPYLSFMDTYDRIRVVKLLAEMKKWDKATRGILFALVGDSSSTVRASAIQELTKSMVRKDEATWLEELLTRQPNDLRRGVLALLLNQKDEAVLASADRLLVALHQLQRLGGLELLSQMRESRRAAAECRARAKAFRISHPRLHAEEQRQLDAILTSGGQRRDRRKSPPTGTTTRSPRSRP